MMGDYMFCHAAGYFIPEEHAKELYNILSKDEHKDKYEKFLETFPKDEPIAWATKIYYEAELKGVEKAKTQLTEEWKWVEPEGYPEEIVVFLKKHSKYGLVEIHTWY